MRHGKGAEHSCTHLEPQQKVPVFLRQLGRSVPSLYILKFQHLLVKSLSAIVGRPPAPSIGDAEPLACIPHNIVSMYRLKPSVACPRLHM